MDASCECGGVVSSESLGRGRKCEGADGVPLKRDVNERPGRAGTLGSPAKLRGQCGSDGDLDCRERNGQAGALGFTDT